MYFFWLIACRSWAAPSAQQTVVPSPLADDDVKALLARCPSLQPASREPRSAKGGDKVA